MFAKRKKTVILSVRIGIIKQIKRLSICIMLFVDDLNISEMPIEEVVRRIFENGNNE